MTAGVAGVGAQGHRRADHAPYIAAVCRAVEGRDIRVADVTVAVSGDGRREVTLLLGPDESAFAERVPKEASASWDEDNGWSLLVGSESVASRVYKGLGVVPDPEDVAAWVVVLLTHPELTPSREDHPFRDHRVADPGFEAVPVRARRVSLSANSPLSAPPAPRGLFPLDDNPPGLGKGIQQLSFQPLQQPP